MGRLLPLVLVAVALFAWGGCASVRPPADAGEPAATGLPEPFSEETTPEERLAVIQLALLDRALDLDDGQARAMLPHLVRRLEAHFEAERTMGDGEAGPRQRRRAARRLQRVEAEAYREMEKVLGPEQADAFREIIERDRDQRPAWKNADPPPAPR